MGCCFSCQRRRGSAHRASSAGSGGTSSSNITTTATSVVSLRDSIHGPALSASDAATPHAASSTTSTTTNTRLASRPNKSLVAVDQHRRCKGPPPAAAQYCRHHKKTSAGPALTRARLERERVAFWDTRVTGRPEVWGAVRLAASLISAEDMASAQEVLDAAGLTCPTGQIWRGVYDEWGTEYIAPEWTYAEPAGVVETDEADDGDAENGAERHAPPEKGKHRMGEIVELKARLSDRGTDLVVRVGVDERVAAIATKIAEAAKLPATARIRIAYKGRILRERSSLAAHDYSNKHVVNAFVF